MTKETPLLGTRTGLPIAKFDGAIQANDTTITDENGPLHTLAGDGSGRHVKQSGRGTGHRGNVIENGTSIQLQNGDGLSFGPYRISHG